MAGGLRGACSADNAAPLFYHRLPYGSESQFNPISSFINYAYDPLQVPESFDDEDLDQRFQEVFRNLTHPRRAIDRAGGFGQFVNRQIFPIYLNRADWVPNYTLHLIGGGMVYRKNVEWFEANGYAYPKLYAAALVTAAELLQEAVEKKTTTADDEVADVYLFRPLGMLLFSLDPVARFAAHTLRLAEWPYQPMVNPTSGKLMNVGENFIVRPVLFGPDAPAPFVYFGFTTLFGMSHRTATGDSVSWGIGAAVARAEPLQLRVSGGVFWDRNDSLLASLVVNGTEDLAVRLNVHPGVLPGREWWSPGVFVGIGRHGEVSVGLTVRLFPLGIGRTAR